MRCILENEQKKHFKVFIEAFICLLNTTYILAFRLFFFTEHRYGGCRGQLAPGEFGP